jgi:hypothetical protein
LEGIVIVAENSKRGTGYPPVTETETRQAAESAAARGPSADSSSIVAAMTEVIEEHRRRIDSAALDPEVKRYLLDLLDIVFVDLLQTVLDEASALDVLRGSRRARGP